MDESEIVKKNYDENAALEWGRLEGFHFEFEITKRYLQKYLRGKTVLDIGGGPGRYSIWLAKQGYDVTLVDLSEGNVAFAQEKFREYGVNVARMCATRATFRRCGSESSTMFSSWGRCIISPQKATARNAFWRRAVI